MSVPNDSLPISYTLSGSGQTLSVPDHFIEDADLLVQSKDSSDVVTTLVLNTDYTVTGAGLALGGSITLTAGTAGEVVTISRNDAILQQASLTGSGQFPSGTVTQMVDRLTMLVQQINAKVKRAVRLPATSAEGGEFSLVDRKNKFVGFDSAGNYALKDASTEAGSQTLESGLVENVTKTGSNGDSVVFDSVDAPTVTLTEGKWVLSGSVTLRTSDVDDTVWAQFYNNTDGVAFGGGAAVYQQQQRTPVAVNGVITVPDGETKVIYFQAHVADTNDLDVGSAPDGPAGYIVATRIAA